MVRRCGGSLPLAELLPWTTWHRVRAACQAGRLVRIRHGVYALPTLVDHHEAAVRAGGVVSHATAALTWGMGLVALPADVHVTVAHGRRPRPQEGVVLHFTREPERRGDLRTSPLRTVLDCAAALPFREALAVADSAVSMRLVSRTELLDAALRLRGPHRQARLRVARAADGRADNPFESSLRAVTLGLGLTDLEPQHEVTVGGVTRHVDLGDPARRIALEADSFAHHGTRYGLVRDCERYDELVSHGWTVLRFAYEQVMFRADWVAAVVSRTYQRIPAPAARRLPTPARPNPARTGA